jgi:L-histidine N-alpha-methyltransferase
MIKSSSAPARNEAPGDTGEEAILEFATAVAGSLQERPKRIPCRFLYDATGSALFEEICGLPEYYLTRTEASILERYSGHVCSLTGPVTLIELGSGTSVKTDYLLSAYALDAESVRYVPVDISESAIHMAARAIRAKHPTVEISGIIGTYEEAFSLFGEHSPAIVIFLGSTIGNLGSFESELFWGQVRRSLNSGDYFLLGVDLVKDTSVIEAAYNDSKGVTAAFMKNIFVRMNRELGAGLDLEEIEHVAEYNCETCQVEIRARFRTAQELRIEPLDVAFDMEAGESVLLEVSRKYVLHDVVEYLSQFGLDTIETFTDDKSWFADLLLQKR